MVHLRKEGAGVFTLQLPSVIDRALLQPALLASRLCCPEKTLSSVGSGTGGRGWCLPGTWAGTPIASALRHPLPPLPAAGWHSVCVGACTGAEVNVCAVTGRPRVPARMWKGMHVHVCVTASVPLACFPTCTRREGLYSLEGPSYWAHPKCSAWLRPLPLPTNRPPFREKGKETAGGFRGRT